jgi:hypothetical protein
MATAAASNSTPATVNNIFNASIFRLLFALLAQLPQLGACTNYFE